MGEKKQRTLRVCYRTRVKNYQKYVHTVVRNIALPFRVPKRKYFYKQALYGKLNIYTQVYPV